MNTRQLRKSIKHQWLTYYADNRQWIARLRIWVDCDGQRRPSSSFILATLSILEPQLNQLLPLIVDLSSNPDRIVAALGLNFNPDEHPFVVERSQQQEDEEDKADSITEAAESNGSVKLLPAAAIDIPVSPTNTASLLSKMDEGCTGGRYRGKPEESEY
ncbi:MAG: DUF5331 domain-containing protein [Leptolyngbyaceae cyanobacterium bins.302]|nr:DUF5331 domain-containing protein [Leptolyngbyaceae cyanobacterium bins.302]